MGILGAHRNFKSALSAISPRIHFAVQGMVPQMCDGTGTPPVAGVTYKNPRSSSTTGRIALSGRVFQRLGGYREDFMPMGAQDVDLSVRLGMIGKHVRFESDTGVGTAIFNHMEQCKKSERWRFELEKKVSAVDKDPACTRR